MQGLCTTIFKTQGNFGLNGKAEDGERTDLARSPPEARLRVAPK
jgi:hypothetical protein